MVNSVAFDEELRKLSLRHLEVYLRNRDVMSSAAPTSSVGKLSQDMETGCGDNYAAWEARRHNADIDTTGFTLFIFLIIITTLIFGYIMYYVHIDFE